MKTTYKYTGLLRLTGMALGLPVIVWLLAVQGTVRIWKRYHKELQQLNDATVKTDSTDYTMQLPSKMLPDMVAGLQNINIIKMQRYTTEKEGDLEWVTHELYLEGTYNDLMSALYQIELGHSWRVASTVFELEREQAGKDRALIMKLLIYELLNTSVP